MSCTRNEIVKQAQAWIGLKESDGSHKKIIDIYNTINPLPRGYKVTYKDAWCAATISALAVVCKATDIIPQECSCLRMIDKAKSMGIWVESDAHKPAPGDIMMYDWDDSGSGDNKNNPDHVGIVEKISGNTITVIEGNYSNAVKRRSVLVNGRYIRGYIVPKYAEEVAVVKPEASAPADILPQLRKGDESETVKAMQILLIGWGYSCGSYGADGDFGSATDSAVRKFQKAKSLEVDGVCGPNTWHSLLGIE